MTHPAIPGNLIADMASGGMHAAIGILSALMARERTGRGQFVDIAMTDGVVSLLSLYLGGYLQKGHLIDQEDRISTGAKPFYNFYETKDGKFISIACFPEPWFYANLCRALDCEEFVPYQADPKKSEEIKAYFTKKFLTKTRDEWFEILFRADVPAGKVYHLDELPSDPQLQHRKMIVEVDHPIVGKVKQPGISVKLSETPGTIREFSPMPGQHTNEILSELGYKKEEIQKLQGEGIIGSAQ